MIAVVQLKRRMTSAGIFGIVVRKFSHWQQYCPVILLEIDKGSKIGLHGTVLLLGLAVSLRIKDS